MVNSLIDDILQPRTDQGVYFQVGVIVVAWLVAVYFSRRNREVVYFVTGIALLALGWRALGAAH